MKYPTEFINIMPYINYGIGDYYWTEQIVLAYSQYNNLSKENLQSWLNDKKRTFDSIMEYVERRKPSEEISYLFPMFFDRDFSDWRRIRRIYESTCLICENWVSNDIENVQLFQFHIQRLENQLTCCCSQANIKKDRLHIKNNYHKNSNGSKRCNYIKSKNNKFNVKGKNFKNKIFYRYG
jgi:hypothetical protein